MNANVTVQVADLNDIEAVVSLFDAYRVWYGKSSDLDGARNFLTQRLRNHQSTVFLARQDDRPAGFAQLYPLFSSVSMGDVWLLNDLFVAETDRGQGVGTMLLQTCVEFARETGAVRIELETELTNRAAQQFYEHHGWQRDQKFLHYSLSLDAADDSDVDASING